MDTLKINWDQKMLDEWDQPITVQATGTPATLRDLVVVALAHPDQSQEDKQARWEAIKAIRAKKDVTEAQIRLCRTWVKKAFLSPVITGVALEALGN